MQTPDELFGDLFKDVQLKKIFPDNKTFVDSTPNRKPEDIVADYKKLLSPSVDTIRQFVKENFMIPESTSSGYHATIKNNVVDHIEELWQVLKRSADKPVDGSSLLALPKPYIVPGGRFREIYYWDSYFTMLGLAESGLWEVIENMIENFAFLINSIGFIPNGNRSYFLSRSQPPYFSCMVELLASKKGDEIYHRYFEAMMKEYDYWMDKSYPTLHVVYLDEGMILNRYYDQLYTPRLESFIEDDELQKEYKGDASLLFRNLRSACESGWDFSGRWFTDGKTFTNIDTTNILPVDLNCLLYHLELSIAKAATISGDATLQNEFAIRSENRKSAIEKYFYNTNDGWYYDFKIDKNKCSHQKTIAGITPFFFNIPAKEKITMAASMIQKYFLHAGGVVTTLIHTKQQWDWPNGWAPLQWITIKSLDNYGRKDVAIEIAKRWSSLNIKVYKDTGKLMEKYNVIETDITAGGGEYPSQDGFGWTNGVLLKLIKTYHL
ncbi:MAG: alpha,alpha-trehalase TreF [Bacteroidetes bacterium]|nr:alpha,alpha-trehalase TreF [Bacteroidota bacterium]